ncbi:hypothetical protein ABKV19_010325 [Rosa sericea]
MEESPNDSPIPMEEPHAFIRQLYDALHMETFKGGLSFNEGDVHRFTVRENDDFQAALSDHFTTCLTWREFKRKLQQFGFSNQGHEFWHPEGLLRKDSPLQLHQIKRQKVTQDHPPISYSKEEKAAAAKQLNKETEFAHLSKKQRVEAAVADAGVVSYRSRYETPSWSGVPCHCYQLQVMKDGAMIEELPVYEKEAYKFGKLHNCDFVLEHQTISRLHAVLQFNRSGDAYIYDPGSSNGTFVNDKKVDRKVYEGLRVNDVIRFGKSTRSYIFQLMTPPISEMATKRKLSTLGLADLKGKRVFLKIDLNVPLDDNFKIIDDTRIQAAVPTIKYLQGNSAIVILASHLGRPKGVTFKYSLRPLVPRLSELLGVEVKMANDSIGDEVEKLVAELPEGGVLLLENIRFYKEEEKNDPEFAKKLASLADVYVNDDFGTAHRAHASTGVAKYIKPSVAGYLMQKELEHLLVAVANPKKPFAAIVGGSNLSSKIGMMEYLLDKVDILLLGGGLIFTFYRAQGLSIGSSLVEKNMLDAANSLMEKAKSKGVCVLLPEDVAIADKFAADANSRVVPASAIPDDWIGVDIGPKSIKSFNTALDNVCSVIWIGPMGLIEFEKFAAAGTVAIAEKLAELSNKKVMTIVRGGDTVAAVKKAGFAGIMSHVSTGDGASLELLEGKALPGILALDDA